MVTYEELWKELLESPSTGDCYKMNGQEQRIEGTSLTGVTVSGHGFYYYDDYRSVMTGNKRRITDIRFAPRAYPIGLRPTGTNAELRAKVAELTNLNAELRRSNKEHVEQVNAARADAARVRAFLSGEVLPFLSSAHSGRQGDYRMLISRIDALLAPPVAAQVEQGVASSEVAVAQVWEYQIARWVKLSNGEHWKSTEKDDGSKPWEREPHGPTFEAEKHLVAKTTSRFYEVAMAFITWRETHPLPDAAPPAAQPERYWVAVRVDHATGRDQRWLELKPDAFVALGEESGK